MVSVRVRVSFLTFTIVIVISLSFFLGVTTTNVFVISSLGVFDDFRNDVITNYRNHFLGVRYDLSLYLFLGVRRFQERRNYELL